MNTLLPGWNRPVTPNVRVIDRELLQVAQESARRRRNWQCANGLLRMTYGCEGQMKTKPIKAVLLRDNDQILDVDGLHIVTNFKMNMIDNTVSYIAVKPDGTAWNRWSSMNVFLNKVVD